MATWYSNHYIIDTTASQTALPLPRVAASAGIKHARKRVNICDVDMSADGVAEADQARFCTMKSGDRITALTLYSDAGATALLNMDLGIYKTGDNNDGVEVDHDIFGVAHDVPGDLDAVDALTFGALTKLNIGDTLWEMATVGAASYTEDPVEDWDIVGTFDTVGAGAGPILKLIVEYTSGA